MMLASCGAEMSTESMAPAGDVAPEVNAEQSATMASATTVPDAPPQLVKRANLTITVDSVPESIEAITAIAQTYRGDILSLQHTIPPNENSPHRADLELRVPQAELDAAIADLSALGEVNQQSITAEDVSSQLVDFEARLRNLRKSEEMILDIMERSGNMTEVLEVTRELNTVRSSIEQIEAQLLSLQNQVSYSTITLSLQNEPAIASGKPSAGTQISRTWQQATVSVGEFTTDMVQLIIWLLVYSPYWLAMGGAAFLVRMLLLKRRSPAVNEDPPEQDAPFAS
jgi:hypothetical protein